MVVCRLVGAPRVPTQHNSLNKICVPMYTVLQSRLAVLAQVE